MGYRDKYFHGNIQRIYCKNQPLKISDLVKNFESININTIKKDLQYLKKEQIIKSLGKGKGTVYIVDEEK